MPRSPLTEQYQRVMSLVEQLHALEPDERNFILDLLVPLPEPEPAKKSQKKSSKKGVGKGGGKSKHATSLASVIQGTSKPVPGLCSATLSGGVLCEQHEGHVLHVDSTYVDYHKFQPGKSSAPTAAKRSSVNGAGVDSTVSSETQPEGASNAHHAGG